MEAGTDGGSSPYLELELMLYDIEHGDDAGSVGSFSDRVSRVSRASCVGTDADRLRSAAGSRPPATAGSPKRAAGERNASACDRAGRPAVRRGVVCGAGHPQADHLLGDMGILAH